METLNSFLFPQTRCIINRKKNQVVVVCCISLMLISWSRMDGCMAFLMDLFLSVTIDHAYVIKAGATICPYWESVWKGNHTGKQLGNWNSHGKLTSFLCFLHKSCRLKKTWNLTWEHIWHLTIWFASALSSQWGIYLAIGFYNLL